MEAPEMPGRYEPPAQERAQVPQAPPIHHAPHAEGGAVPDAGDDLDAVLSMARELFFTDRTPRDDPMFYRLRPHLVAAEARLGRHLAECPDDAGARMKLREVGRYLGRRP